jgi:hypothetical protein
MHRFRLAAALACAAWPGAAPAALSAQSLPSYASMNPMVQRRSGLAMIPWLEEGRRAQSSWQLDYASSIEYTALSEISYLLDAELLRLEAQTTRAIGRRGFLLLGASVRGAYDGLFDGFLDWYHNLTGLQVEARKLRPRNEFAYQVAIAGEPEQTYEPGSLFLGDLRVGAGLRHSRHWMTALTLTLPTGTGPDGFRRGVPTVNATTALRSNFGGRFTYEGTLGAGYAATRGEFEEFQHTTFLMVTQGLRGRVSGPLHLYANLIYHSALYHDTGARALDSRELTLDAGGFLKFGRGPEWLIGVTQDLEPTGPAIDVGIRLGARW